VFIRDLIGALDRAGIRYCLVGGVAVNLHGVPRLTYDVDLVVAVDPESLRSVRRTLESLGLRCRVPVELESLSDHAERARLRDEKNLRAVTFTDPNNPLNEVDVLVNLDVDTAGVIDRAELLDADGLPLRVASLEDLIAMKRAAGRDQDLSDVEHLERLLAARGGVK
jgi:predicted nucleotidyltransferase